MVLISAETLLPMFLLWSRIVQARFMLAAESVERKLSPFWIKPEWSVERCVCAVAQPASQEVGQTQRVGNLVRGPLISAWATGKASS